MIEEILKLPDPLLGELQRYVALLVEGRSSASKGWPAGYFQKTAGSFAGQPLERPEQLDFEKRQEW